MRVRASLLMTSCLMAAFCLLAGGAPSRAEDEKPKKIAGQRVFTCGHSFHFFMPPILADVAKKGGVEDHKFAGLSQIGGSRVIQHWDAADLTLKGEKKAIKVAIVRADDKEVVYKVGKDEKTAAKADVEKLVNQAKELLGKGEVDVLTLSPIYLPDDGIGNFVDLTLKHNKDARILIQANWLPWDTYDPKLKGPAKKVERDDATIAELKKSHEPYFESLDDHVRELNKKASKDAVFVVPVGQAVLLLREKVIAGKVPGVEKQSELFTDPLGHVNAHVMALNAYCHYAVIYRRSPVGIGLPAVLKGTKENEKLNRLLQELAWEAVTAHPLSGVEGEKKKKE